ncbi:MAG: DMT family transporter [Chloroflexi bacterium]|nr:DMT family transporter [Chloroflexota bacterium]
MKNLVLLGVLVAVGTGIMIGAQATLTTRGSTVVGPVKAGLMMAMGSGVVAALTAGLMFTLSREAAWDIPRLVQGMLFLAGAMGVAIVIGLAFALQQVGVTAGLASILLGQMLVSVAVDALGWGTGQPIPVTAGRILGLAVLALAVYLLLPRA